MQNNNLLKLAFEKFDAMNGADPRVWCADGVDYPQELFFSERHTEWVKTLASDASEALLLASRCQHICRWESPRSEYPAGRAGYLKWRSDLKFFHADKAAEVLAGIGYDAQTIERVKSLNLKQGIKSDPECQILEDALCLTFLQFQFDALIADTDPEKMLKIVRKTWAKMSEKGHAEALKLDFSGTALAVVQKALA